MEQQREKMKTIDWKREKIENRDTIDVLYNKKRDETEREGYQAPFLRMLMRSAMAEVAPWAQHEPQY